MSSRPEHTPSHVPRPSLRQRLKRWVGGALATLVIALAILVGLFRLLVPQVSEYRDVIAQWAGEALGAPVEIASIDVRWRWLVPEVVLRDVVLSPRAPGVDPLQAAEIAIQVSPLDLVRPGPMRPGQVVLRGGEFAILRDASGRIRIPGVAVFDPGAEREESQGWRSVLIEILANADYRVVDSRLRVRDDIRGLGPWQITVRESRLHSSGSRHRYRADLMLPAPLDGELTLDLDFRGPAVQPEEWQWAARMELSLARFSPLMVSLELPYLQPLDGGVETRLRAGGKGLEPATLSGDVWLRDLEPEASGPVMRGPSEPDLSRDIDLRGIDWQRERGGWRLMVSHVDLSPRGHEWPGSSLSLRRTDQRFSGNLRYARLQDIASLARRFLTAETPLFPWLERLRPEGELRDLLGELHWEAGELQDYSLRGRLTGLGMNSWEKIPGFAGLNGWLRADSQGGRLDIDAGPVHFDYPDLFRERLSAERLHADVSWTRNGDHWRLQAEDIRARNQDARARAKLALDYRPGEPVWVELDAEVPEARSDNLSDYLPVGRMPEKAVAWMDEAIQGGVASNGRVRVDGPTRPFPYKNDEGVFRVSFDVADGRLDYEPGFPPVTDASAQVVFEQAGLRVRSQDARVGAYRVSDATAHIPDLEEPVLSLSGDARGRLRDGLDFLRQSPLGEWFAGPLGPVDMDGEVDLEMAMEIPVDAVSDLRLDGRARLSAAGGSVDWLPGSISDLAGELVFTEDGARSEDLSGQYLGHPFQVAVDPGSRGRDASPDAPEQTVATLEGGANVEALRAALPDHPLLDWLDGDFRWQGEVRVPNQPESGDIQVRLDSDLAGLAVNLPAPAGKSADTARSLQVRFPVGGEHSRVEAEYGGDMAITLDVAVPQEAVAHIRGLRIDMGQPRRPAVPPAGIAVHGRVANLDGPAWLGLDWPGEATADAQGLELETLSLSVDALEVGHLMLNDQQLMLDRRSDHWQLAMEGPDARGVLWVPFNVGRDRAEVTAELTRLNLRPHERPEATAPVLMNPVSLPAITASVESLLLDGRPLGALDLILAATPDGVRLDRLQLSGAGIEGDLVGEWHLHPEVGQWGGIRGQAETEDVAAALERFGFVPGVEANIGRLVADLHWQGPPGVTMLSSLSGQASLEMRSGQLREVSPGAGRVFGLMSFSALPRRLYGDFRDVFGRGLRFDRINGDFVLANGDAFTGNLRLEGPVANVSLMGRTGLVTQDYDQLLTVDTQVGSALPVAGALAGGVGVGAAMLVISELFRGPLSRMGRLEYRIEGSWESPRVTPLDEDARRALDED